MRIFCIAKSAFFLTECVFGSCIIYSYNTSELLWIQAKPSQANPFCKSDKHKYLQTDRARSNRKPPPGALVLISSTVLDEWRSDLMLSDQMSLPVGLVKLNAKLSPKKYMLVPRSTKVKEERLYLTLHCHHQNDCIKTGSGESRFNVSLTVREGQSHKTKPTSSVWRERRADEAGNRTEVLLLTSLTPYR